MNFNVARDVDVTRKRVVSPEFERVAVADQAEAVPEINAWIATREAFSGIRIDSVISSGFPLTW